MEKEEVVALNLLQEKFQKAFFVGYHDQYNLKLAHYNVVGC